MTAQAAENTISLTIAGAQKYLASSASEAFASEAAKKEAAGMVARGYKLVRAQFMSAVWSQMHDAKDAGNQEKADQLNELSWEIPMDLHHWRQRHGDTLLALSADLQPLVDLVAVLFKRREEIKAAAIVRKTPKREQPIQAGDKTQERGHCQCCAREHAVNGYVAQHGYTVKHGFFNGVCPGHQYRPMEVDRTVTDSTAQAMREKAISLRTEAQSYRTGELVPKMAPAAVWIGAEEVPFSQAPAHMQERTVQIKVANLQSYASAMDSQATTLQAYADKYHGKALKVVKV